MISFWVGGSFFIVLRINRYRYFDKITIFTNIIIAVGANQKKSEKSNENRAVIAAVVDIRRKKKIGRASCRERV